MGRHAHKDTLTVKTITHGGRTVDLCVDDRGTFYGLVGEHRIESKSLDSLQDRVRKYIATLGMVAIPATLLEQHYEDKPTFVDVELIGSSGRKQEPLLRLDNGRTRTKTYSEVLLHRISKQEKERFIAAWDDERRAVKRSEQLREAADFDDWQAQLEAAAAAADATSAQAPEAK